MKLVHFPLDSQAKALFMIEHHAHDIYDAFAGITGKTIDRAHFAVVRNVSTILSMPRAAFPQEDK